jgi:hypothetical protein
MKLSEKILEELLKEITSNGESDMNIDSLFYTKREIYTNFISLLLNQTGIQQDDTISSISMLPNNKNKTTNTTKTTKTKTKLINYYADIETMAFQLSIQLQYLENQGFSLLFWQPSDIMVIHIMNKQHSKQTTLYLLSNLSQLISLLVNDQSQLRLVYPSVFPFPKERCAPELFNMNSLPFITHRSASYYSLGLLCLWCLNNLCENLSLETIQGTKLFYFIERCLKKEPAERILLYL